MNKDNETPSGEPLSLEKLEEILEEVWERAWDVRHHLPERPVGDEPVVLTEYESKLYHKYGQFTRHWRDGSYSVILSPERMEELKKLTGDLDK